MRTHRGKAEQDLSFVASFSKMNLYFLRCKRWASRYVTKSKKDNVISQKHLERYNLDKAGEEIQSEGFSRRNRAWLRYSLRRKDSLKQLHTNWQNS